MAGGNPQLKPEQYKTAKRGRYIYLENIVREDVTKISAYVLFDDKTTNPLLTKQHPESFVKYSKYEIQLMDKMKIKAGFVTIVKWYTYSYLWKVDKSHKDYKERGMIRECQKLRRMKISLNHLQPPIYRERKIISAIE